MSRRISLSHGLDEPLTLAGRRLVGLERCYGDDGDDLMMALARQVISGEQDAAETVFAQARDAESVNPHNGTATVSHTALIHDER